MHSRPAPDDATLAATSGLTLDMGDGVTSSPVTLSPPFTPGYDRIHGQGVTIRFRRGHCHCNN